MELPSKPKTVVIDGKVIEIKQLPPGPIDPDARFDRWSHDDVRISPQVERSEALAHKDFGSDLFSASGRRTGAKKRAD